MASVALSYWAQRLQADLQHLQILQIEIGHSCNFCNDLRRRCKRSGRMDKGMRGIFADLQVYANAAKQLT